MSELQFDLVVVGGGLAGLAAANRCAEGGLRVAVLERGEAEHYPCNSRFAMGFITCASGYIRDAPEQLRAAIRVRTRGFADPGLADVFASNAGPAVRWLESQGIRLVCVSNAGPRRAAMLTPPPLTKPGLNWQGRGADVMMRRLIAAFEARGGRLLRGMRARELTMESGRCVGVAAVHGEAALHFSCAALMLADGGFQANEEMLKRYIMRRPDRVLQRNAKTGTGDGLCMAIAAGARVRGMDRFYGHVQSKDALENPTLWPYPVADALLGFGMAVDSRARRFADEGLGGVFMANEIARLDDPLEAVAVFDRAIWEGPARKTVRPPNPLIERAGGTIYRSDSLEGLAAFAGLPASAFAETVATYNRCVDQGETAQLDPPRSGALFKPMPVRYPPFYAVPLCAGITYTMGGLAIDTRCRVQHVDGHPIPGLFAAGSTTGGHEGGPVAGYTGGLGKALTFGWHAGNSIAEALRRVPNDRQPLAC